MMCAVCYDSVAVLQHPYQHFSMHQFGVFDVQDFALCAECQELWERHLLATLAQRFIVSNKGYFRNVPLTRANAYGMLCCIQVAARLKLN